jgi:CRP-like cAMP-binding protein
LPDVPTGESERPGDAPETEVAAPVAEIDAPSEAPVRTSQGLAAEPEPVSEPLDEDLPTLHLDDVPTSEAEDDELPTLELDEEEADEPESDTAAPEAEMPAMAAPLAVELPADPITTEPTITEPVPAEPVIAEPVIAEPAATEAVGTEALVAEPLASLGDAAEGEPTTITPEGVPAASEVEALVTSAAPLEADPKAMAEHGESPGAAGPMPSEPGLEPARAAPARPAARPTRTGELEAFISLSEDMFQDQVADLIEEMLVPGAEPEASGDDAPPAPARSLLSGPLFEGLSDDERVALVRGLKLRTFEAGDVVLTEGETGSSLFLLTAGAVRIFVRNPAGSNKLLDDLGEGDFFGEISLLSGRPRNATVTAAALCEMLELDQAALAEIEALYPRVSERLQSFSRARAASAEAAALRESGIAPDDSSLESHFDDGRLEPRLRLRLADAFLKAGQEREAGQVLIDLADELVRHGQNEKAVALLKKVEQLQRRAARGPAQRPADPAPAPGKGHSPGVDDRLGNWLIDVARDTVRRRSAVASRGLDAPVGQALDPRTLRVYRRGLVASPLFEGLSEDELLALVRGLQLRTVDPGDIVLTEGEPGQSIFIVATGQMKVFIRNPTGHDVPLCGLGEGAFFGEISALSGRSRTATVTAAAPSVLLELDAPALEAITRAHPRVQELLETVYIERASDPSAEAIRGQP